ncbi:hypothetical protein Pcinc_001168 [Petrolisthes cinctipes]|uniref:Uncharacterized protein n=1 Tax=Petrolisthes cinctipes TaxID=88211 RepID=A0AAE1L4S4_PETCI|nr:hypothetical protein Pcinc_001168 [Petrolisthes cinctipes]
MRQNCQKLLGNSNFKNEQGKFMLHEWGKEHYCNIFGGKTGIVSYGGDCYQYIPDDQLQMISVTKPAHLQGDHEEADTLIAFHAATITAGHIIVRASDTDMLVILIGAIGSQRPEVRSVSNRILDCGMGNTRRFINVSNIVEVLEECKSGLPQALPGYHAFTGCDFTSAFYRKGKVKPFNNMKKDATRKFVEMFISMGDITGDVDADIASKFENPLANIKRVDCALLPPTRQTLKMKIRRSQYVAALWRQATEASPGSGLRPSDFG